MDAIWIAVATAAAGWVTRACSHYSQAISDECEVDESDEHEVEFLDFDELADTRSARLADAGRTTIARAVFTQSAIREGGRGGRDGLLAGATGQDAELFSEGLRRLTPCTRAPTKPPQTAGLSASEVSKAVPEKWSGSEPTVVQSAADLPVKAPADARGMYHDGKLYLVANNLHGPEDVEVADHESEPTTKRPIALRHRRGMNKRPATKSHSEHVKHALRKINEYRRKQAEKIPAENEPVSGWDPADASPETDGAG